MKHSLFGVLLAWQLGGTVAGLSQDRTLLTLEKSPDLKIWEKVTLDSSMLDGQGRVVLPRGLPGESYRLRIESGPPSAIGDLMLIPAGTFQMGDNFYEGDTNERPVHTIAVSAFYLEKYEVSKAAWDGVALWAAANGYDIAAGSVVAKAQSHPVYAANWFESVKWCNARSQKEGLEPCYTVGGQTYRTGDMAPQCNFAANGYRLPTEAEWEWAARGGLNGQRFPWGATISHTEANYEVRTGGGVNVYGYDVSPTAGMHPLYAVAPQPYTAPVATFAPNGYGIHNMVGNVSEWCWDWFNVNYYENSPDADPTGPSSGTSRVVRGGSWSNWAYSSRIANREGSGPGADLTSLGFRVARSVTPR